MLSRITCNPVNAARRGTVREEQRIRDSYRTISPRSAMLMSLLIVGALTPVASALTPVASAISSQRASVGRRAVCTAGALLSGAALTPPAGAELDALDYLSPARFAVKKQRQKQEQCYDAGECADAIPYYAIECARGDDECLQRRRRLASQEWKNFSVDPTSSPILFLAASAFVLQWGAAGLRIGAGLLRRARGEPPDDG